MTVAGIIPARFKSTRFPGKPLADIGGRPMIQYVYERARRAARLDRLLVATDDSRIVEAVRRFGGEVLYTSPDHASGTDRLAEAGRLLGLLDDDIVVNIQGDEPLVEPVMIHRLIEALESSPEYPMATLAFRSASRADYLNPNIVKVVVDCRGRALYFSRSPIPAYRDAGEKFEFFRHLGFYAYRHAFLQTFTGLPAGILEEAEKLEQLRAMEHGYGILVAPSPVETQGVDTPEDLAKLMTLLPEERPLKE
ncbi:MAG: 3-deoxy-manno-octulosonate cytidylyltransferase [Syntrophobacteraceae bacterium]|nr:3-deoxy-manno-octulosonate cytidylyltransferase [Desulfobacteraceae bacterium]